jgi:hypothetical protein
MSFHDDHIQELIDGINFCDYHIKQYLELPFSERFGLTVKFNSLNKKRSDLIKELRFLEAVRDFKSNDNQ